MASDADAAVVVVATLAAMVVTAITGWIDARLDYFAQRVGVYAGDRFADRVMDQLYGQYGDFLLGINGMLDKIFQEQQKK